MTVTTINADLTKLPDETSMLVLHLHIDTDDAKNDAP